MAASPAGKGASPFSVRKLAQSSAMVPSIAAAARTRNAGPRLASHATTTAVTTDTAGSPHANARPRSRSVSSPPRTGAAAGLPSVIEVLQLVVQSIVVAVLLRRHRRLASHGASAVQRRRAPFSCPTVAASPPPHQSPQADSTEADGDDRYGPDPPPDSVIRGDGERFSPALPRSFAQALTAQLPRAKLLPTPP